MENNKQTPNQHQDQALVHCPRCDSTETKFCYYNNYSLSQPRHFCKSCRRYWTKGGTLRNVPVGGLSRKNKKLFSSTSGKPATSHRRRQSPPQSPAQVAVYPNFREDLGGGGGEYEGDGLFPASGGYGADTGNTRGLSSFGEMEYYENLMMNEVDVKTKVLAFEWEEQTGCHSDLYGSGDGRNGSFGYLMGLGSHGTG